MYKVTATSGCDDSACPLLAVGPRDEILVQGYTSTVTDGLPGLPTGESRVVIPRDVWEHLLRQHRQA